MLRSPWLRTGRAVATFRFLLAAVFLISLWIDPAQPIRQPDMADFAMAIYLAWSVAMLAVAWTSWRMDVQLALPALAADAVVFIAGLYFTEGESSTFASPYVAGFVFLVFSTLLRWGRRRALEMGAAMALCYVFDCQLLEAVGVEVDMLRMVRRLVYMAVIALAFVWISPGAGAVPVTGFVPPADALTPEALLRAALAHAMALLGARGGALAWGEADGLPRELIESRDGTTTAIDLEPEGAELLAASPGNPRLAGSEAVLWSPRAACALTLSPGGGPVLTRNVRPDLLVDCARGGDAVVVPVVTSGVEARLVLWSIPGICGDDLRLVEHIRREIEAALDRNQIVIMQEREMAARLRSAVARDLHDGVAQSLAGALLRLEGLRAALRNGREPFGNLDDASASLRAEQANVRDMIRKLREGVRLPTRTDLPGELRPWLDIAGAVWGIGVRCNCPGGPVPLNALVAFEVRQLLREAVANAARHGKCRHVAISIERGTQDSLVITVEDDGRGLAPGEGPRSIAERLAALGGALETGTAMRGGARLTLSIPGAVTP